jgi:hypothetical protein
MSQDDFTLAEAIVAVAQRGRLLPSSRSSFITILAARALSTARRSIVRAKDAEDLTGFDFVT